MMPLSGPRFRRRPRESQYREALPEEKEIRFERHARLDEEELQRLFDAAWGERKCDFRPVLARSFTWITAHVDSDLIGFVNVAWDGGVHFFLVDTTVHPAWQRRGIGARLVRDAIAACRGHGEWMHVDFGPELRGFYENAGFGLIENAGIASLREVNASTAAV
jgi:GNAT superfamily N-acetyltransferase